MTTNNTKPSTGVMRKIMYILASVLVVLFIAALLMPKDIKMSVRKEINVPRNMAFNLVNNQQNVRFWSSWIKEDSSLQLIVDKVYEGDGSGYKWTSKKDG